jgi:NADH:ubiquinone oxidoreductase subunit 6 (subunit J)
MNDTLFWIIASLMVPAALAVVWAPSVLYAALGLLSVFLLMAALFLLQQAYFLAVSQVMVYAVGLVIVFLFGLMLTGNTLGNTLGAGSFPRTAGFKALLGLASAALVTLVVVLAPLLSSALTPANAAPTLATVASVETLGTLLLSRYALPFEVVSIFLLMAMVGAIVLAKKPEPPTPLETTTTGEAV